jgi:cytochrome c553
MNASRTGSALLAAIGMSAAVATAQQGNAGAAGADAGVAQCAACHGAHGEGNAAMNAPKLAGQAAPYLVRELDAYAGESRNNPVMSPIAKALTPAQRQAAAQYYAALPVATAALGAAANGSNGANAKGASNARSAKGTPNAQASRAERLANVGDERLQVQACGNCHGAGGRGEPPSYPYLASQHAGYLQSALKAWQAGARDTDASGQMNRIARQLNDADIAAIAQYYASQPPPDTLELQLAPGTTPQAGAAASSSSSATTDTAQPSRPAGTEQGSPTTGGTQGQGGAGQQEGSRGNAPGGTK